MIHSLIAIEVLISTFEKAHFIGVMSGKYISCARAKELERDYVKQEPKNTHYWEKTTSYVCRQNERTFQDFDKEFATFEKDYFDSLPNCAKVIMNFPGMGEGRLMKWVWYTE